METAGRSGDHLPDHQARYRRTKTWSWTAASVLEEERTRQRQASSSTRSRRARWFAARCARLTDFGAFLDLGGIDGLLHVADISWAPGEQAVGRAQGRATSSRSRYSRSTAKTRTISLGLKQMSPDPWSAVEEKYKPGDRVRGKVTRVTEFGAFVELEPGIEGLIRMSDRHWSKKVRKPADVVKPGELVEVVVLNVSAADKRIGAGPEAGAGRSVGRSGEEVPGRQRGRRTPVPAWRSSARSCELAEGVEGMIHIGDITNEKRINHPQDVLKLGRSGEGAGARNRQRAAPHAARHQAADADQRRRIHRRAQGGRCGDRARGGHHERQRQGGIGRGPVRRLRASQGAEGEGAAGSAPPAGWMFPRSPRCSPRSGSRAGRVHRERR